MIQGHFIIVVCLLLTTYSAFGSEDESADRAEKLISTFQIVRFPNDVCVGSNSRNGTCYTSAECSDKGGTSSGSCADGFGVCCTFIITTCDQSSSENLTYWTQPSTVSAGTCSLTVCPTSDEICSIRLDLTTFVITGPSARTTLELERRFGQVAGAYTAEYLGSTQASNCKADQFSVSGTSPSSNPPTVCGTLTGQHMYVEADTDRCNKLTFSFGAAANTVTLTNNVGLSTLATRTWDITATQIECTSLTLPPPGCTQYFWGDRKYTLYTANWLTSGTSLHLANQHDRFCVRRERGYCIGCFSATSVTSFALSGGENGGTTSTVALTFTVPGGCCGYGTSFSSVFGPENTNTWANSGAGFGGIDGENAIGYGWDCIIIPGAFGPTNSGGIEGTPVTSTQTTTYIAQQLQVSQVMPNPWPPQICGNLAGIGVGMGTVEGATMGSNFDTTVGIEAEISIGNALAANASVCTRATPFILEFMSDDLEGIGGETGHTEYEQLTTNRGFELVSTQLACS